MDKGNDNLGTFDADILFRLAKDKLVHLLECSHRDKALIIQSSLMKRLDRILGTKVLKQHGVVKMYRFEEFAPSAIDDGLHHVFIIKPNMVNTRRIVRMFSPQLATCRTAPRMTRAKCQIVYVPKKMAITDALLERCGCYGLVETTELSWSFLPIDNDVLSLELDEYFTSAFVEDTTVWCQTVAQALWHFQSLFGPFPDQIYCFGKSATVVANLTEDAGQQLGFSRLPTSCCSHMLVIDRNVDPVTLFLSGLTYETLLDDHFGIEAGFLELPNNVYSKANSRASSKRVLLNANECSVYKTIRDLHFARVFAALKMLAEMLQTEFDKRHHLDVDQLKTFVKHSLRNLKQQQQNLALHIGLSEHIVAEKSRQHFEHLLQVEQAILCKMDYARSVQHVQQFMAVHRSAAPTALGLLCLLSIVNRGLVYKDYAKLRHEFLQAYGYDYYLAFTSLERCKLFYYKQSTGGGFNRLLSPSLTISGGGDDDPTHTVRERFRLVVNRKVDLKEPRCPSYVFNGAYVPLACQLVMQIIDNNLPSEQSLIAMSSYFHLKEYNQPMEKSKGNGKGNVFLIVFLGGVTRAEIAALRLVEQLKNCHIRIVTTNIASRSLMLRSMQRKIN